MLRSLTGVFCLLSALRPTILTGMWSTTSMRTTPETFGNFQSKSIIIINLDTAAHCTSRGDVSRHSYNGHESPLLHIIYGCQSLQTKGKRARTLSFVFLRQGWKMSPICFLFLGKKKLLLLNFKVTGHTNLFLFPHIKRVEEKVFPFYDTLDNSRLKLVWKPPS